MAAAVAAEYTKVVNARHDDPLGSCAVMYVCKVLVLGMTASLFLAAIHNIYSATHGQFHLMKQFSRHDVPYVVAALPPLVASCFITFNARSRTRSNFSFVPPSFQ